MQGRAMGCLYTFALKALIMTLMTLCEPAKEEAV